LVSEKCGTSDLPFVLEHCDLLSVLELGSTIARGTPKEIIRSDVVRDAYLS
jgi:ABC-type branched-subunit amino acid transport system ATPase component